MALASLGTNLGPVVALSPLGSSRDPRARAQPGFEPGQLLSARVLGRLGDGTFAVELAGQTLRMTLPGGIQTGERLTLVFASEHPRLTFLLKQTQALGEPAAQLSPIGRQVAAMMAAAGAPGSAGALPAVISNLPALIGSVPAQGAPLAGELGKSMAQSGLFYESHQAQWAAGQRSLAQLSLEPQARLATATVQRVDRPETGELSTLARAPEAVVLAPGSTAEKASGLSSGANAPSAAERIIHPATLPLVQQQLGALESGRVAVQVEVWPRQWMQWDIQQQPSGERAEAQGQSEWRTLLRLDLPSLGAIEASLTLRGDGLHVLLRAADNHSAALLAAQRTSLHQALEDAGLPASVIAISSLEPASDPAHPSVPAHRRRPGRDDGAEQPAGHQVKP